MVISEKARARIDAEIAKYPVRRGALLPALHIVHEELGHVARETAGELASIFGIPPHRGDGGGQLLQHVLCFGAAAAPRLRLHQPALRRCAARASSRTSSRSTSAWTSTATRPTDASTSVTRSASAPAGIERRAYTAGENKDFLDPFAPKNPAHREHAKKMLEEIHQQFIKVVRDGRGARLKDSPEIFSGLVWTGERAVHLGLADGYGSLESVARDVFTAESVVDYTPEDNYFEQLSKRLGSGAAQSLLRALSDLPAGAAFR